MLQQCRNGLRLGGAKRFDVSSVMFLYGIFYGLFKEYGWKWDWLRRLTGVSTPVLSGHWAGTVQSDYDGAAGQAHAVEVTFGQDWTHITVRLVGLN